MYTSIDTNNVIPIMHCFDNNYVIPAAVSFYSMLKNANSNYIYKLYVLHSDITVQNQIKLKRIVNQFPNAALEFIDMAHRFDDLWKDLQFAGHYSKEVLYKLLVASIFPQYDKLIITDVDVVFLGDISPSFFSFEKDDDVYFAGVHQIMPHNTWLANYYNNYIENFGPQSIEQIKICGGYLVANLNKLRSDNMEKTFVDYLKRNAYRLLQSEQDVINFCCAQTKIKYLSLKYVVCSYQFDLFEDVEPLPVDPFYSTEEILDSLHNPVQLHYATGIKPWNQINSTKSDIWYQYLAESGFFMDFAKRDTALHVEEPSFIPSADVRKNQPENRSPLIVSVLCCTYNHEKFIREALDSIVSQKVDFPFEIIIADDASTDKTQEIIKEYYEKYPHLIVPILRDKNLGIGPNYYDALNHVRGKYLAICDGDDQWIDPLKLKKQVDFLDSHPDYTICCSGCIKNYINNSDECIYDPSEYIKSAIQLKDSYNFKDLLYCRFVVSSTAMMRWQLRNTVPSFLQYYNVIDFTLVLLHAACGKIKVMENELFSKYNIHDMGITSSNNSKVEQETFRIIYEVNQYLDYKFSKTVADYIVAYKQYIAWVYKQNQLGLLNAEAAPEKNNDSIAKTESLSDENPPAIKSQNGIKQLIRKVINLFCILYRECCPELLKRLWRLFKKALVLLYRECIPNIFKRGYRFIKRKVCEVIL